MNAHRGDISFEMGGKQYVLCYKWEQIQELKEWLGGDFLLKLGDMVENYDMRGMSRVIAVGLKHHYGKDAPTEADVFDLSPAITEAQTAINLAINRSNYGAKGAPDENPKMAERVKVLWKLTLLILSAKRSLWLTALD